MNTWDYDAAVAEFINDMGVDYESVKSFTVDTVKAVFTTVVFDRFGNRIDDAEAQIEVVRGKKD